MGGVGRRHFAAPPIHLYCALAFFLAITLVLVVAKTNPSESEVELFECEQFSNECRNITTKVVIRNQIGVSAVFIPITPYKCLLLTTERFVCASTKRDLKFCQGRNVKGRPMTLQSPKLSSQFLFSKVPW